MRLRLERIFLPYTEISFPSPPIRGLLTTYTSTEPLLTTVRPAKA